MITGGMGFVGSHLCEQLLVEKHNLVILTKSLLKKHNVVNISKKIKIEKIDVTDFKKLGYLVKFKKIRFEKFNVPQRRHRIIILGYKNKCNLRNFVFPKEKNSLVTCGSALEKLNCSKITVQNLKFF